MRELVNMHDTSHKCRISNRAGLMKQLDQSRMEVQRQIVPGATTPSQLQTEDEDWHLEYAQYAKWED